MKKTVCFILMFFVSLKAFASQEDVFYFDFDINCLGKMPHIFCRDKNGNRITGTVGLSYNNKFYGEYYFENGWIHDNIKYFEPKSEMDPTETEVNVNMIHGKEQGLQTVYLKETGDMLSEVYFKDGKENGIGKFYKNGIVWALSNIENGKANGVTKFFDKYGNLTTEMNFKNDKKDGITKSYYNNGKLKTKTNFEEDRENGLSIHYFEDGRKNEINYKNGKKDGRERLYDKDGNIIWEEVWSDGVRVK